MNLYNYTFEELEEYILSLNCKKYNAIQIYKWLYQSQIDDISEMTNIKKDLRNLFVEKNNINTLKTLHKQVSKDGTTKYLFELPDGNTIETVLMKHNYGNSVCVTSQVGCNLGCKFCASGLLKKKRDLLPFEMVLQILQVSKDIGEKIHNIVVMGIGEPFDNYDNVLNFIRIVNHKYGLQIGSRHITVSTCGLVDKIREFADFDLQVNLAISLHASNDALRDSIMPINKKYNLEKLLSSLKYYYKKTNRRITFEYILLKGVNDSVQNAKELSSLLRGLNCYINLIPYNSVSENEFKNCSNATAMKFFDLLKKEKLTVTLRREMGSDIDAACGQLRYKREGKDE